MAHSMKNVEYVFLNEEGEEVVPAWRTDYVVIETRLKTWSGKNDYDGTPRFVEAMTITYVIRESGSLSSTEEGD